MLAPGRVSTLHWSWGLEDGAINVIGLGGALKLCYQTPDEDVAELVELVAKPAQFGGRRHWLKCPGCGQTCRVLRGYNGRFRCRRCHRLPYASQYEQRFKCALGRADSIAKRLHELWRGATEDAYEFPPKPPRMRWSTYQRLEAEYDRLQSKWLCGALTRLGL
jgi:hypothetical protein